MAQTDEIIAQQIGGRPGRLVKSYDKSAADTELTVSTPADGERVQRLIAVMVAYSGNVTKNVTVTFNSAQGSDYDALIQTIALSSAADGSWIPDEKLLIAPGDAIDVVAPAGGSGVTSTITVLIERV